MVRSIKKIDSALRGQTVRFVNYKWILQQAKIRFAAKSATLLIFYLCSFGFQRQIAETLCCSKSLQNMHFAKSPSKFVELGTIGGIHKQTVICV